MSYAICTKGKAYYYRITVWREQNPEEKEKDNHLLAVQNSIACHSHLSADRLLPPFARPGAY